MKRCSKCGEEKGLDGFYFEKGKPRAKCKVCHRAQLDSRGVERRREIDRRYIERHRDAVRERLRTHYAENHEEINARRRAARAADPERFRQVQRDYRQQNRDRIEQVRRAWYALTIEERRAVQRAYVEDNRGKVRAWDQARRERDVTKIQARSRAYYADHSEQWDIYRRRREAKMAAVEYQPYTRREIYDRDGGECQACGKALPYAPGGFQIDHIVPIDLKGPDIPANLQLLCPPCNRRKWANLEGQIHLPVLAA